LHTSKTKLDATGIFSENKLTQNWLSKVSYAQSKDNNSNNYITGFGPTVDSYVSTNKTLNWNNTIAINSAWTLTAGLERQKQSVVVDDGYGGMYTKGRTVNALFAGLLGQVGASSFQLNTRRDSASGMDSKATHYLGYGFAFNPNWKVTASTSTAFNVAPLGYLYAPYFGNANLQPETAKSKELGLQFASGKSVLRATLFDTQTNNQFEYDFNTYQFANIKQTKNSGLELSFSTQIGNTDIKGSLTSQNPVNVATGLTSNRRAKALAAISISQPVGQWRLGADMRYTGDVKDGTNQLKSYSVLDLSARYEVSKTLSAYARVENAANTKYQTVYSYNAAPRGVAVGLNWQPGF
jgi:vitamin B12 transporter